MAGLDKILESIQKESESVVAGIMSEATAQKDAILKSAKEEAQKQCEKITQDGERAAKERLSRAQSAADLQCRRALLKAKQELIGDTVEKAREAVTGLPDKDYFNLILRLVSKNALAKEGEICFNKKDFARLPSDFASGLVKALPEGASLTVAKEDADIDGGFVLRYGGIEQNCSVSALFEEKKEEIQDLAGKVLLS